MTIRLTVSAKPCFMARMKRTLITPYESFAPRKITRTLSEHVAWDNRMAQDVAAPLFHDGLIIAGITERTDYCSGKGSDGGSRPHYHDMTLLMQGSMCYEFGGRTQCMSPGDLACMPSDVPFRRSALKTQSWWLYFQIRDTPDWAAITKHGAYIRPYASAALMFHLLRDVLDAMASHEPHAVASALASSQRLAALLRHEMLAMGSAQSRHANALAELIDAIARNPEMTWDRVELARRLCISESMVTTLFQKELGIAPHQFVLRQRMNSAVHQLFNSRTPIKTIAEKLGYQSLHSFTRLFAKHVGLPPGQYRERYGYVAPAKDGR